MPLDISNILGKPKGHASVDQLYTIGGVLGRGAFGVVRECTNKKTGEKLACKTISKAKLACKEDIQDVQREVAIMYHVGAHPNIVNIKETFEDRQFVHMIMERCKGGELFDSVVSRGSYTEKQAAAAFTKMVKVVHHCHELGVMHRDLKPENFLLTEPDSEEIKATDFGLSIFFSPGDRFKELVGSPYYVAPEVLKKNYSKEADMWSLGVILYILLSGLPPFWGNSEEDIFRMVIRGKVDFQTEPWPKLSQHAKDCVGRLLTMDPRKRATGAEILRHPWLAKQGCAEDKPLDSVVMTRMKKFAAMTKMKKTALMVVGTCLNVEEIAGMRALFTTIDADGSGTITLSELKDAMGKWGHKFPTGDLQALLDNADVDGNGQIDYNEFVAATLHVNKLQNEETLQKAFREFDTDNSGKITAQELAACLRKFGIQDDVASLIKAADADGDGQIDYAEFQAMLREKEKDKNDLTRSNSVLKRSSIGFV